MSFFDSLIQTPVYQAQSMLDTYSNKPGQALVGANTPLETNLWNKLLGTNMTPTMNMYGGPSEATYAKAKQEGVDLSAGRAADAVVPAVAGAVGSVFGGPAGGMAASYGANAIGQMGRQGEIAQINAANQSKGLPPLQAQSFAKGGLTAANDNVKQTQIMKVIANYFQNMGIPVEKAMAGVQKEIQNGLKLIPYESSVMGVKDLGNGTAQVHFFTVGTIQSLSDDMKYFYNYLKKNGIKVIYDTAPAPVTFETLKKLGAYIEESDNPKFKMKATI
jgi:hypothetical protein